ncbi:hypothetical protein E1193_14220 [Micromonospora sp. KC606]|uniref:fascin domain-containing protein n=1 Tax=Micromonospora sp. KC606 TaxID=2530379 RepID=UPI00104ECBEE|nr:hypothetical protein [Micromonospora sp. KC606]TDC81665.1 hypothetical protein E1193_14220 [Micromonospora sp. KC606]
MDMTLSRQAVVYSRKVVTVLLSFARNVRRSAVLCMLLLAAPLIAASPAQAGVTPDVLSGMSAERMEQVGSVAALCRSNVAIRSTGNGRFVSADLDRDPNERGMLRASWASTIGPWELFTVCFDYTWWSGPMTLYSQANGQFVAAELNYGGPSYAMLRARASQVGPWERFILNNTFNTFSIQSEASGLFVTAEIGYSGSSNGMLRARSGSVGAWEKFEFVG